MENNLLIQTSDNANSQDFSEKAFNSINQVVDFVKNDTNISIFEKNQILYKIYNQVTYTTDKESEKKVNDFCKSKGITGLIYDTAVNQFVESSRYIDLIDFCTNNSIKKPKWENYLELGLNKIGNFKDIIKIINESAGRQIFTKELVEKLMNITTPNKSTIATGKGEILTKLITEGVNPNDHAADIVFETKPKTNVEQKGSNARSSGSNVNNIKEGTVVNESFVKSMEQLIVKNNIRRKGLLDQIKSAKLIGLKKIIEKTAKILNAVYQETHNIEELYEIILKSLYERYTNVKNLSIDEFMKLENKVLILDDNQMIDITKFYKNMKRFICCLDLIAYKHDENFHYFMLIVTNVFLSKRVKEKTEYYENPDFGKFAILDGERFNLKDIDYLFNNKLLKSTTIPEKGNNGRDRVAQIELNCKF